MRKITFIQTLCFILIYITAIGLAALTTQCAARIIPPGDVRGVLVVLAFIVFFYVYLLGFYRMLLALCPLKQGNIPMHSQAEFVYHIHLLFFLLGFHPLIRSSILPVPLLKLVYLGLGAKMGKNSYTSGIIYEPIFVRIGDNVMVGERTLLTPHAIEGTHLSFDTIEIGDNATIGAGAILLPGVRVHENAVVAAGAVVPKNTVIGAGEIWGGIPARLISTRPTSA